LIRERLRKIFDLAGQNLGIEKPTSRYQSGQLPRSPFLDNFQFADRSPGIVLVWRVSRQYLGYAPIEFRPVLARYQSTSWNRSRSLP
jgi:hypothetical protein